MRHLIVQFAATLFVTGFTLLSAPAQTQSAPATTRSAVDLSTPEKAAAVYIRAFIEEDGALLLASSDTREEGTKTVVTGRAAQLDANRHYRDAVKKAFGEVKDSLVPSEGQPLLMKAIVDGIGKTTAVVEKDRATVTPVLPPGEGGGDWGPMFRLALVKTADGWRVRVQECGQLIAMGVDPGEQLQADLARAAAGEMEAVAAEIAKGAFKDAAEANQAMQKRSSAARDRVMDKLKAASPGTAPRPATTGP